MRNRNYHQWWKTKLVGHCCQNPYSINCKTRSKFPANLDVARNNVAFKSGGFSLRPCYDTLAREVLVIIPYMMVHSQQYNRRFIHIVAKVDSWYVSELQIPTCCFKTAFGFYRDCSGQVNGEKRNERKTVFRCLLCHRRVGVIDYELIFCLYMSICIKPSVCSFCNLTCASIINL